MNMYMYIHNVHVHVGMYMYVIAHCVDASIYLIGMCQGDVVSEVLYRADREDV